MIGEQQLTPSSGVKMEHGGGFSRKIEQNHVRQHAETKEEAANRRSHESAAPRVARRLGFPSNKTAKPTMEIYRPPNIRDFPGQNLKQQQFAHPSTMSNGHNSTNGNSSNGNTTSNDGGGSPAVTFSEAPPFNDAPAKTNGSSRNPRLPSEIKSALKRSKSFGAPSDGITLSSLGFGHDSFPAEYHGLIKRALMDPNTLTSRQLMEVVRVICNRAVDSVQNAEPAAQMCLAIIEKEKGKTFLESLFNSCREWFNERDKLLRAPLSGSSPSTGLAGVARRWTAYVSFLTELYMRLQSRHRQAVLSMTAPGSAPAGLDQTLTLVMLLYECCQIILKPPSLNNAAEVECLRSVLTSIGRQLETDSPTRMQQLVSLMRDAFVNPSLPSQGRKTLLELVELHASQWQLDLPQSMYYFPYTSMDRK